MHVIYILPGRIIEAIRNSMDLQRILNTPPHPRFPSEIPETPPPLPESQISTRSWDSQLGPQPATPSQSPSQSSSRFVTCRVRTTHPLPTTHPLITQPDPVTCWVGFMGKT